MSCERLRSLWETYLDGELPSQQMLELQAHLDECTACANSVAFSQAIRRSARQLVQRDAVVTDEFRARLASALRAEARSERHDRKVSERRRRLLRGAPRWGVAAMAAAACVAFFMQSPRTPRPADNAAPPHSGLITASLGPDEILDRLLDYHTAPPQPQVTEPKLVPELEKDVGVRVPLPTSLARYGAEWEGGSVIRVRGTQPTAYLRFRTPDRHNVTLYVYNANRIPLHAVLKPRMYREEPIYEGYRRGYSIAAQLSRGVGYAIATDLDEPLSAEMVRAIASSAVTR